MKKRAKPLNPQRLQAIALRYVERYATSSGKLTAYLRRKIRECGWDNEDPPEIKALAERFAALGYVNDRLYAEAKARDLAARGFGARRLEQHLYAAGISEDDGADARSQLHEDRWAAADRFARKRKIGPYAVTAAEIATRQKQLAAFLRAGHDLATARRFVDAQPGDAIAWDD